MQSVQELVDRNKGAWDRMCYDVATAQFGDHEGGRLARGLALAQQGAVTLGVGTIGDTAIVAEVRSGKTVYEISHDLTCPCKDFNPALARACKHLLAYFITREVVRRLSPPGEAVDPYCILESEHVEGLTLDLDEDGPELAGEAQAEGENPPENGAAAEFLPADTEPAPEGTAPVAEFLPAAPVAVSIENPAGYNLKARVGNIEHWYTLHEVSDDKLIARLKVVVPAFYEIVRLCEEQEKAKRLEPPAAPIQGGGQFVASAKNGTPPMGGNDTDRSWCPHHAIHMDWHPENDRGPGWYSHRLGTGGYCRGGN